MGKIKFYALFIIIILFCSKCKKVNFEEENGGSRDVFETFWNEIDLHFSFFEYLNLDWDSVYTIYDNKISDNTSPFELYSFLREMTLLLKDGHTNVFSNYGIADYPFIN